MSGPATAVFVLHPAFFVAVPALGVGLPAVILALEAAREAREMHREYQEVLEEIRVRASSLAKVKQEIEDARIDRRSALHKRATLAKTRLVRLRGLLTSVQDEAWMQFGGGAAVGAEFAVDAETDSEAWQLQLHELEREVERLQSLVNDRILSAEALAAQSLPDSELPSVAEAVSAYMMRRALHANLDTEVSQHIRGMVARILSRLDLDADEAVPLTLDTFANEIALAPDLQRAEALALELRLRVQRQREERARQRADVLSATELMAAMGDDAPQELRDVLERVAAGELALQDSTRELVQTALSEIEQKRERLRQEAAALLLEQSLRDLGYSVDGVESTLFIEGGVAHFQRHGWGSYFVRLRVGVEENTLNFNVVRAAVEQESAEQRRLDALAEDRWCREFPELMKTLAARGIELSVTRLLKAGEVPVQVVDARSLPAQADEDRRFSPSKLKELKR